MHLRDGVLLALHYSCTLQCNVTRIICEGGNIHNFEVAFVLFAEIPLLVGASNADALNGCYGCLQIPLPVSVSHQSSFCGFPSLHKREIHYVYIYIYTSYVE